MRYCLNLLRVHFLHGGLLPQAAQGTRGQTGSPARPAACAGYLQKFYSTRRKQPGCAFAEPFSSVRRTYIAHGWCERGFQRGGSILGTRLWYKVVCVITPCQRCYTFLKCKKSHANTLTVRTWDLMLPRPNRVLVTNPDKQLLFHFSKTVLRTPRATPHNSRLTA